jgi:asparagine synthase (glutamine-hydrolysing)
MAGTYLAGAVIVAGRMCGIAGQLSTDGPIEAGLVERMCATMEHRGPDSSGVFAQDGVAVGVQRLAVIDVAGADQPIRSEDGSVVVVCNGEIYNYRELRQELVRAGHTFSTAGDAEVVVHLYEELGDACLERLRGMFALAIWDGRRRRLLLARDRVGKKPLFYAQRGGRFWFASEPRAILATGQVPRDVDWRAIDLFLHYQCVPAPHCAFAALRKLPPGHLLEWSDGVATVRRWWKLSYRDRLGGVPEEEVCELIRETVLEATRLRLRSDVPVGAMLSGGVDSSAVVAAMARLSPEPVRTFSIGFDVAPFDESASAREVARAYGTDHHELVLDAGALDALPRLAWHYGEPFADSSALACFALAGLASRHVTVALNGDGGDETFAGYERYARDLPTAPLHRHYAERRAHQYFDEAGRAELYEPEFRSLVGQADWRAVVEEPYFASDAPDPLERTVDVDVRTYLGNDLLVKMDIATMAHSLEARSPLCDQAVMELGAGLPMATKVQGQTTKAIFKRAMREWLPGAIVDRPKMGFMIPIGAWLRDSAPQLAGDVLLDPRSLERGVFREDAVRAMVSAPDEHAYRIWTLLQLELWLRTYVDTPSVEGPLALSPA